MKYEQAEEAVKIAVDLEPNNTLYLNNWGDLLFKLGRYDEAEETYRKAIKVKDKLNEKPPWRSYLGLAKIYINIGDTNDEDLMYEEALMHLHTVVDLYPDIDKNEENKKDYYYQRGYAHAKLGHWKRAERDFRQCKGDPKAERNVRRIRNRAKVEGRSARAVVYGGWALSGVSFVTLIIFCVFFFRRFKNIDTDLLKILIPICLFFISVGVSLPYIRSIKGPGGIGFEKETNIRPESAPVEY